MCCPWSVLQNKSVTEISIRRTTHWLSLPNDSCQTVKGWNKLSMFCFNKAAVLNHETTIVIYEPLEWISTWIVPIFAPTALSYNFCHSKQLVETNFLKLKWLLCAQQWMSYKRLYLEQVHSCFRIQLASASLLRGTCLRCHLWYLRVNAVD